MIAANIGALPDLKDARVKLIGVTAAGRSKFVPEIAAIAEGGLAGYEFDSWFGLPAPVATPRQVREQVGAAMGKLLKAPVILKRLAKQGIEPQALSPEDFDRLLRADVGKMAHVVKAFGCQA